MRLPCALRYTVSTLVATKLGDERGVWWAKKEIVKVRVAEIIVVDPQFRRDSGETLLGNLSD